jgi:hypothetical protein
MHVRHATRKFGAVFWVEEVTILAMANEIIACTDGIAAEDR